MPHPRTVFLLALAGIGVLCLLVGVSVWASVRAGNYTIKSHPLSDLTKKSIESQKKSDRIMEVVTVPSLELPEIFRSEMKKPEFLPVRNSLERRFLELEEIQSVDNDVDDESTETEPPEMVKWSSPDPTPEIFMSVSPLEVSPIPSVTPIPNKMTATSRADSWVPGFRNFNPPNERVQITIEDVAIKAFVEASGTFSSSSTAGVQKKTSTTTESTENISSLETASDETQEVSVGVAQTTTQTRYPPLLSRAVQDAAALNLMAQSAIAVIPPPRLIENRRKDYTKEGDNLKKNFTKADAVSHGGANKGVKPQRFESGIKKQQRQQDVRYMSVSDDTGPEDDDSSSESDEENLEEIMQEKPVKNAELTYNRPNSDQNRPDLAQSRPKTVQNRPDFAQSRPYSDQNRQQSAQSRQNLPQNRPNVAQNRPDSTQNMPDLAQRRPGLAQPRPDSAQLRPDSAQRRPDSAQLRPETVHSVDKPSENRQTVRQRHPSTLQPNRENPVAPEMTPSKLIDPVDSLNEIQVGALEDFLNEVTAGRASLDQLQNLMEQFNINSVSSAYIRKVYLEYRAEEEKMNQVLQPRPPIRPLNLPPLHPPPMVPAMPSRKQAPEIKRVGLARGEEENPYKNSLSAIGFLGLGVFLMNQIKSALVHTPVQVARSSPDGLLEIIFSPLDNQSDGEESSQPALVSGRTSGASARSSRFLKIPSLDGEKVAAEFALMLGESWRASEMHNKTEDSKGNGLTANSPLDCLWRLYCNDLEYYGRVDGVASVVSRLNSVIMDIIVSKHLLSNSEVLQDLISTVSSDRLDKCSALDDLCPTATAKVVVSNLFGKSTKELTE